jgi:hypothetical protein
VGKRVLVRVGLIVSALAAIILAGGAGKGFR